MTSVKTRRQEQLDEELKHFLPLMKLKEMAVLNVMKIFDSRLYTMKDLRSIYKTTSMVMHPD